MRLWCDKRSQAVWYWDRIPIWNIGRQSRHLIRFGQLLQSKLPDDRLNICKKQKRTATSHNPGPNRRSQYGRLSGQGMGR